MNRTDKIALLTQVLEGRGGRLHALKSTRHGVDLVVADPMPRPGSTEKVRVTYTLATGARVVAFLTYAEIEALAPKVLLPDNRRDQPADSS